MHFGGRAAHLVGHILVPQQQQLAQGLQLATVCQLPGQLHVPPQPRPSHQIDIIPKHLLMGEVCEGAGKPMLQGSDCVSSGLASCICARGCKAQIQKNVVSKGKSENGGRGAQRGAAEQVWGRQHTGAGVPVQQLQCRRLGGHPRPPSCSPAHPLRTQRPSIMTRPAFGRDLHGSWSLTGGVVYHSSGTTALRLHGLRPEHVGLSSIAAEAVLPWSPCTQHRI